MARDRYERVVPVERDGLTEKQKAALVSLLRARAIDSGSATSTYLLEQKHGEQVSGNVLSKLFTRGLDG